MLTGKLAHRFETRDCSNAPINVNGPGLTGVIGTQACQHVFGNFYVFRDWLVIDMCSGLQ